MKKLKLSKDITIDQFNQGYWYAAEIKSFARELGIRNFSSLRKDELEYLIKKYIITGRIYDSNRKNIIKSDIKDIERGLNFSLPVKHYTSNKITKAFIKKNALKLNPNLKIKSGAWYRLNRWRDDQLTKNKMICYGDLIHEFIRLNDPGVKFERIPVGRYINFIADYMANEKKATRQQAIREWKNLKNQNVEKEYSAWKKHNQ